MGSLDVMDFTVFSNSGEIGGSLPVSTVDREVVTLIVSSMAFLSPSLDDLMDCKNC